MQNVSRYKKVYIPALLFSKFDKFIKYAYNGNMSKNKEQEIEYIPFTDPDKEKQMFRELVIVQEEVKQIKQIIKDKLGIEVKAIQ